MTITEGTGIFGATTNDPVPLPKGFLSNGAGALTITAPAILTNMSPETIIINPAAPMTQALPTANVKAGKQFYFVIRADSTNTVYLTSSNGDILVDSLATDMDVTLTALIDNPVALADWRKVQIDLSDILNKQPKTSLELIKSAKTLLADNTIGLPLYNDVAYSPTLGLYVAVGKNADKMIKSLDGENWTNVNFGDDPSDPIELDCICWNSTVGEFYAVGHRVAYSQQTVRARSSDGTNWIYSNNGGGMQGAYTAIVWCSTAGRYVACSNTDSYTISSSASGDDWTWSGNNFSNSVFEALAYSPTLNIVVAVASSGSNHYYSTDGGLSWSPIAIAGNFQWFGVAWSDTLAKFCAVGRNNAGWPPMCAMTSVDGINWTLPVSISTNNWQCMSVCWSSLLNVFVASYSGQDSLLSSVDGVNWLSFGGLSPYMDGLTKLYSNSTMLLIVGGSLYGSSTRIWKTTTGLTWLESTGATPNLLNSMAFGDPSNGEMLFLADAGTIGGIRYDGWQNKWYTISNIPLNAWKSVCWNKKMNCYTAVASSGAARMVQGSWAQNLNPVTIPLNSWEQIIYIDNSEPTSPMLNSGVAISSDGANRVIVADSDVNTWTPVAVPLESWKALCYAPELNLLVAIASGANNLIMTSTDTVTWVSYDTLAAGNWKTITWSPERKIFLATSLDGLFAISSNGVAWTVYDSGGINLKSVLWSVELQIFAAVDGTNSVWTSPDGLTWSGLGFTGSLNCITWNVNKSRLYVSGSGYRIGKSTTDVLPTVSNIDKKFSDEVAARNLAINNAVAGLDFRLINGNTNMTGDYKGSTMVNGSVVMTGGVTHYGDLFIQGSLQNPGGYSLYVYGRLYVQGQYMCQPPMGTYISNLQVTGDFIVGTFTSNSRQNQQYIYIFGDLHCGDFNVSGLDNGTDGVQAAFLEIHGSVFGTPATMSVLRMNGGNAISGSGGAGGSIFVGGNIHNHCLESNGGTGVNSGGGTSGYINIGGFKPYMAYGTPSNYLYANGGGSINSYGGSCSPITVHGDFSGSAFYVGGGNGATAGGGTPNIKIGGAFEVYGAALINAGSATTSGDAGTINQMVFCGKVRAGEFHIYGGQCVGGYNGSQLTSVDFMDDFIINTQNANGFEVVFQSAAGNVMNAGSINFRNNVNCFASNFSLNTNRDGQSLPNITCYGNMNVKGFTANLPAASVVSGSFSLDVNGMCDLIGNDFTLTSGANFNFATVNFRRGVIGRDLLFPAAGYMYLSLGGVVTLSNISMNNHANARIQPMGGDTSVIMKLKALTGTKTTLNTAAGTPKTIPFSGLAVYDVTAANWGYFTPTFT